jgi:tRNA (uracil-5-)-methyltransferase TRM9
MSVATAVAEVYDEIAEHFSSTRYKPWRGVRAFLESQPAGSTILEVGCGNGKNLGLRTADCIVHGCDPCEALVDIAAANNPTAQLVVAGCGIGRSLPYEDSSMDVVMAIAVLHHLETETGRLQFITELARVWKGRDTSYARGLVTVWATSAVKPSWKLGPQRGDYLVPWHRKDGQIFHRYYHVFERDEVAALFAGTLPIKEITFEMDNWYVYF